MRGFSLIEVMVALFIGSLLSMVLFQSLSQASKALRFVDDTSHTQTEKTLLDRQWDRDFSGMFAPLKKIQVSRDDDEKKTENAPAEQPKQDAKQKEKEKEEEKYHPDAFAATVDQNNMVTMFTCITSNPALMYGNLLPRIVRVVYKLVPEKDQEGRYALVRQQSDDLELAVFTKQDSKIRAYTLASGIKSMKLEAWVEKIPKKEDKKKKDQQPPSEQEKKQQTAEPKKRVFVPWQEWKKVSDDDKKKFELALIPALIKMTVTFIQGKQEREQVFWYAPLYGIQPVVIEGPSALLTNKERDGRKQAQEQYGKINEQLQDFNDRVLSKKMGPPA